MTAQCALYKWIEWAVTEIWPFEIIQDGGLPPTWIWCTVTGNSAIRSADPENPTLIEPNMKCMGSPVADIWPFAYLRGKSNPHLGEGGRRGSAMALFVRAIERWWFPIGSPVHCDSCASCHSAAICDRMSPTLKSTGARSLWAKISGCSPWSADPWCLGPQRANIPG